MQIQILDLSWIWPLLGQIPTTRPCQILASSSSLSRISYSFQIEKIYFFYNFAEFKFRWRIIAVVKGFRWLRLKQEGWDFSLWMEGRGNCWSGVIFKGLVIVIEKRKKKKGSQLMQGRRNRAERGREELFALCIWIWEMGFNCLFKYGLGQVFSKGNI